MVAANSWQKSEAHNVRVVFMHYLHKVQY